MNTVSIFCDESGTMPAGDADGVFCVAGIITQTSSIELAERTGFLENIAGALKDLECIPQVVFVEPQVGYGNRLGSKMAKMNAMARASRLVTGSHDYLPGSAHNSGNLIWLRCMAICVVRAVVRRAEVGPIGFVRVVSDKKSLAGPTRRLFEDRLRCLREDILGPTAYTPAEGRFDSPVVSNIRFTRDQVSVTSSSRDKDDGLYLADRLCGLAKASIEKSTQAELARELGVDQDDLFYNATPDVIHALPKWSVERWKHRTGLPEPRE